MVSHRDVAEAWFKGNKATGSRMFTDGKTVYSYGYHFPIAHWFSRDEVLFNTDGYSSSTERHKRYVRSQLYGYDVIECDTDEIKRAVDTDKVIITREVQPKSFHNMLDIIYNYLKVEGVKRVPKQYIRQYFEDLLMIKINKKKSSLVIGGNKLSIKDFGGYSIIKSQGKELKVFNRFAGNIALAFSQYTTELYHKNELRLIEEKCKHNTELRDFVTMIINRGIKYTPEKMAQIVEQNKMIEDL